MKTPEEIQKVLDCIDPETNKFHGMNYDQGIEIALMWVMEEIKDDEFEFSKMKGIMGTE